MTVLIPDQSMKRHFQEDDMCLSLASSQPSSCQASFVGAGVVLWTSWPARVDPMMHQALWRSKSLCTMVV